MEKVEDIRVGETKEVRPKGARGMSLRPCVAKAAAGMDSWEANSTTTQETSINKALWFEN